MVTSYTLDIKLVHPIQHFDVFVSFCDEVSYVDDLVTVKVEVDRRQQSSIMSTTILGIVIH